MCVDVGKPSIHAGLRPVSPMAIDHSMTHFDAHLGTLP